MRLKEIAFTIMFMTSANSEILRPASSHPQKLPIQSRYEVFRTIEKNYLNEVEPIFRRACFDCHTNLTEYPWYYKVPVVKQWIDEQVHQGQKALTILSHFPFIGHNTTPEQDLVNIGRTLHHSEMPPLEYSVFNPKGRLSKQEVFIIHQWVQESLQLLQATPSPTVPYENRESRSSQSS